jgi:hypothetical protein
MEQSDMKWFFIAAAVIMGTPMVMSAVNAHSLNMARRDIIVACYNAGRPNCEALWSTVAK